MSDAKRNLIAALDQAVNGSWIGGCRNHDDDSLESIAYSLPKDTWARSRLFQHAARLRGVADALKVHQAEPAAPDAAVAAIQFAIQTDGGLRFLKLWNEGEFNLLRECWPEAPDEVYIGADPLFSTNVAGG